MLINRKCVILQYGTTKCYLRCTSAGFAPHDDTGRAALVCHVWRNGTRSLADGAGRVCYTLVCRYRHTAIPFHIEVERAGIPRFVVCLSGRLCLGEGDGYGSGTDGDVGTGLCLSGSGLCRTDVFRGGCTHQGFWHPEDTALFSARGDGSYRDSHRSGAFWFGHC